VIAPELAAGINPQTSAPAPPADSLRPLLRRALGLSALIFGLLEVWRPYYFLTDDNLDGGLPFFTEVGRNLLAGHSPFISHHLFGGDYNLLRDPTYFTWHPLYLLVSLLAGTPFHLAIIDVDAFFMLMLATAGFVVLAHHLRREMPLALGDGWIIFYALSYTYTMMALTTGASWSNFLGNIASLPWLTLGIMQSKGWRGTGIVALFVINQTLGGHLAPTISNSIFLSLFALGLSVGRRSPMPLANWLGGYVIALVIMLPLLCPVIDGFNHSLRAAGVTLEDMQQNNIPAGLFPISIFLGMAAWPFDPHAQSLHVTYTLALGSAAAAWCVIPALASRAKWRGTQGATLLMVIFGAVMIIRPFFVTQLMAHLPLFKSMRWPFREFVQFQFFLHLFLVVRPPGLTLVAQRVSAFFGTFVYVVPLVFSPFAPTFNTMTWDRELLISGRYEDFWQHVRPLLKPGDRVAVIIPLNLYEDNRFEEPYILLGSYNYAALDGFINAWGYSPTVPRDQVYTKTYAYYPFGAYHPDQRASLLAEKPDLQLITLESLHPLCITLSSRDGPVIDLTPFVPLRESKAFPAEHDGP
jgi:hypothetical protein